MSLILLRCSNCGADLDAEGSTQFFRCHYCGKTSLNPAFTAAPVPHPEYGMRDRHRCLLHRTAIDPVLRLYLATAVPPHSETPERPVNRDVVG